MDTAPGLGNQANDAEHIQIIDDSHEPESEELEELREERVLKPPQPMNFPNRSEGLIEPFVVKRTFENLDGRCLDMVAAYTGGRLPGFVFANKKIFDTFLTYQI